MQAGHLLIERLRQQVDIILVCLGLFPILQEITNDGWPVAQPKFNNLPEAKTITPCPSGKTNRSTCGLMFSTLIPGKPSRPAISISLSKWPMLPTIALFFMSSCAQA